MALDLWIAFVLASASMLLLPGPTVLLVVAVSLVHGRRAAWVTVPAVTLGGALALALSLLGLGALLQTWPALGVFLRLFGVAYLAVFAWTLWWKTDAPPREKVDDAPHRLFWSVFAVTTLNPNGLVFFLAFIPHFLNPDAPLLRQSLVLAGTYLALVVLVFLGYALLAGRLADRGTLRRAPWMSRVAAVVLLAAALGSALSI
jgi:threonine/homoserine/homoserine lactone efflux protein